MLSSLRLSKQARSQGSAVTSLEFALRSQLLSVATNVGALSMSVFSPELCRPVGNCSEWPLRCSFSLKNKQTKKKTLLILHCF